MLGLPRLGTFGYSNRPDCSVTIRKGEIACITLIGDASNSCGIGSRGFRRARTNTGGTYGDKENSWGKGDFNENEEARELGRSELVSDQRRGWRPRPSGCLLWQVVRDRRAQTGGLALLLHLWSSDVAGGRCLVG